MTVRSRWLGEDARQAFRRGAANGLQAAATIVKDASLQVVPREDNELAASADTDVDSDALVASAYYDPPSRPIYAIVQHEALSYRHPPGEQAKFLEKPMRASRGAASQAIANEIAKELR